MKALARRAVQVGAVLSVASGVAFGWLDEWDQGTYSLVLGALGLWAVDRWDDIWGPS